MAFAIGDFDFEAGREVGGCNALELPADGPLLHPSRPIAKRLQFAREEGIGPADARNPHHVVLAHEDRPLAPPRPGDPGVLEDAHDQPAPHSRERTNLLARHPAPNRERLSFSRERLSFGRERLGREPRGEAGSRLKVRRRFPAPGLRVARSG